MGDVILAGFWLIVSLVGIMLGLTVYGLPTIVAVIRKSPNIVLIAVVNLVLGGLFVPWWIALGMALWSSERRGGVTVIQATNLPPVPPAGMHGVAHAGPYAPAQGALPAPLAQRPAEPPTLPPSGERENRPFQQPSSPMLQGFGPPAPYAETSATSHRPPTDRDG